jgi:hypothetical protein
MSRAAFPILNQKVDFNILLLHGLHVLTNVDNFEFEKYFTKAVKYDETQQKRIRSLPKTQLS